MGNADLIGSRQLPFLEPGSAVAPQGLQMLSMLSDLTADWFRSKLTFDKNFLLFGEMERF